MVTGDLGKAGCSPKEKRLRGQTETGKRQRARALQLTAFGLAPSRARRRYRRRRRRLSRCSRVYSIRACSFSSPAPSASSLVSSVSVGRTQAREGVGDVAVQGNLLRLASREVSTSGTRAVSALVIFFSYAYADASALRVAGIYLLTRARTHALSQHVARARSPSSCWAYCLRPETPFAGALSAALFRREGRLCRHMAKSSDSAALPSSRFMLAPPG
jgi:hypothetical protein